MNELVINNMHEFMRTAAMIIQGDDYPEGIEGSVGPELSPYLQEFEEIYFRINRGCPCTKKNRERHAEITFKNVLLTIPPRGKTDLIEFFGVGRAHSKVIIMQSNTLLLELESKI